MLYDFVVAFDDHHDIGKFGGRYHNFRTTRVITDEIMVGRSSLAEASGNKAREQRDFFAEWLRLEKQCLVPRFVPSDAGTQEGAGYTFGLKLTEYLGQNSVEIWAVFEINERSGFEDEIFEEIAKKRFANRTYVALLAGGKSAPRMIRNCKRLNLGLLAIHGADMSEPDNDDRQASGRISRLNVTAEIEAPHVDLSLERIRKTGTDLMGIHSIADLSACL